jgi:hypothetical protein
VIRTAATGIFYQATGQKQQEQALQIEHFVENHSDLTAGTANITFPVIGRASGRFSLLPKEVAK